MLKLVLLFLLCFAAAVVVIGLARMFGGHTDKTTTKQKHAEPASKHSFKSGNRSNHTYGRAPRSLPRGAPNNVRKPWGW